MSQSVEVISHWHHSVENFTTSAMEFYKSVEESLKAKEAPNVRIERIDWSESGILSAKREYLRISYGRFSFDLCAAPFGKDYFFSWWLVKRQPDAAFMWGCAGLMAIPILLLICLKIGGVFSGFFLFLIVLGTGTMWIVSQARAGVGIVEDAILAMPVLGMLYTRFLMPVTYYSTDTRLIFEESVHKIILNHVETLRTLQKLPPLSPAQAQAVARKTLSLGGLATSLGVGAGL